MTLHQADFILYVIDVKLIYKRKVLKTISQEFMGEIIHSKERGMPLLTSQNRQRDRRTDEQMDRQTDSPTKRWTDR